MRHTVLSVTSTAMYVCQLAMHVFVSAYYINIHMMWRKGTFGWCICVGVLPGTFNAPGGSRRTRLRSSSWLVAVGWCSRNESNTFCNRNLNCKQGMDGVHGLAGGNITK